MQNALHDDAGKTSKSKPKAPQSPPSDAASHHVVTYTLRVLSTTQDEAEPDRIIRTVLFQRQGCGESIEISAETDAPNLLASLPDFVDAALAIQKTLWPAQRTVSKLPSNFFPLLVEESRLLRQLAEGPKTTLDPDRERRRLLHEAMIVRDVAWEALRTALGPRRRHEIDALVGPEDDPMHLAKSADALAAFIDRMIEDVMGKAILMASELDAGYAAALRKHAAILRALESVAPATPEDEPKSQRGLRRLIGTAYRALGSGAFMVMPKLGSLSWSPFGAR